MQKKNKTQLLLILLYVFIIAGVIFLFKLFGGNDEKYIQKEKELLVYVKDVVNKDFVLSKNIMGKIVLSKETEITAGQSGKLKIVSNYDLGTRFKKGDLIAEILSPELNENLNTKKDEFHIKLLSIMADIEIDFPKSAKKWKKFLNDFSRNRITPQIPKPDSDREKYFLESRGIYIHYDLIRNLDNKRQEYFIKAQTDGYISDIFSNNGAIVSRGQVIGKLKDISKYELEVPFEVRDLNHVKVGQVFSLKNIETNQYFKGILNRISDKVDDSSQSVLVYLKIDSNDLIIGEYLSFSFKSDAVKDCFEIENHLIDNENQVYLVKQDSILFKRGVDVLKQLKNTSIVKGLENGEKLVVSTLVENNEGEKVRILKK